MQKWRTKFNIFPHFHFFPVYIIFLSFFNLLILSAQPKFVQEASGLSGLQFCDVASFLLLFFITKCLFSLGGFAGGALLTFTFCGAAVDAFCLALPLKIVFDPVLLAFTDTTSLMGYKGALYLVFALSFFGGLFLKKHLPGNLKKSAFWGGLFFLLAFISLFSGSHSALDKRDFWPWHAGTRNEIFARQIENDELNISTNKWAHKLRESWGGFAGDSVFIFTNALSPNPKLPYYGKSFFPKELKTQKNLPHLRSLVLIMGESSNPLHYENYNYPLHTTPALKKLEHLGLACHLTKAHSAANTTRYAVLPSISFWEPGNLSAMVRTDNVMSLAKQNGFETFWISKQIENNFYAGFIGYHIETAENMATPNESHGIYTYAQSRLLAQWNHLDNDLIPLFEKAFATKNDTHFIGIHLIGNHLPYYLRSGSQEAKALPFASAYDRSVRATDSFLEKILHKATFYDPNALIFYVSDHGEDLEHGGHGLAFGKEQYQIPVIFIGKNASYWCHEAEKFRQKNGYYSSLSNNLLISEMLGYQIKPESLAKRKEKDILLLPSEKAGTWEEIPEAPPKK